MADLTYQVVLDWSDALRTSKQAGNEIKNNIENALNDLKAERIRLINEDDSKSLIRDLMTANGLMKKGKANADDLKAAYAREIRELKKSVRERQNAQKEENKLLTGIGKTVKMGRIYNETLDDSIKRLAQMRRDQKKFNDGVDKMARKMKKGFGGGILDSFVGKFTKAGLAIRAIEMSIAKVGQAIGSVIERSQKISELKTALGSYISAEEDVVGVMAHAKATAMAYGVSLNGVEKAWKRVGPAANAAGLSMGETSKLIEAVSARTAQMGLNAEQTGRYMEAVAQVMGKNKLQSEELTQQFSELDGAMRSQLAGFFKAKYGIEDLGEAMKKGQIDAKMFGEGIIAISEGAMKNMITNTEQLITKLNELKFNQVVNQLQTIFAMISEKAGTMFSPLATSLAEATTAVAAWFLSFEKKFPKSFQVINNAMRLFGHLAGLVIKGLLMLTDLMYEGIERLIRAYQRLPGPIKAVMGLVNPMSLLWGDMGESIADAFAEADQSANTYLDTIHKMPEIQEENIQKAREMIERKDEEANSAEALAKKYAEEQARRKAVADGVQALIEKYNAQEGATNSAALASDNISESLQNEKMSVEGVVESIEKLAQARQKAAAAAIKERYAEKNKAIEQELRDVEKAKRAEKERHDAAIKAIRDEKEAQSDKHREIMRGLEDEKKAISSKKEAMNEYYRRAKEQENERHRQVMASLDAEAQRINKRYDRAIDAAQSPSAAQQELNRLKESELRTKARSTQYSRIERLEAQAQLDAMIQQQNVRNLELARERQLAVIEKRKAIEKKKHEDEVKRLDAEKEQRMERLITALERVSAAMTNQKRENEDINEELDDRKTKEDDIHKAANKTLDTKKLELQEQKRINTESEKQELKMNTIAEHAKDIHREISNAASDMSNLGQRSEYTANQMERSAAAAERIEKAVKNTPSIKVPSATENTLSPKFNPYGAFGLKPAFSGGPVSGGAWRQVNELGQEAFLSNSGKLSMINAPSFGAWRAPSSGTIIPAHITSQLNIPASGVKASNPQFNNVGEGNQKALVKAIRGIAGGGNTTNNVTIQSTNTSKAASDILVSLARIKRRRYN